MRHLFAAAAFFCCSASVVSAEEQNSMNLGSIDEAGPENWEGMYLGVAGSAVDFSGTYKSFDLDRTIAADYQRSDSISGNALALLAGINWQADRLVYGLELSASKPNAEISYLENYLISAQPHRWSYSQKVSTIASIRGRVGYSFGETLVYGSAGAAFGKLTISGYDTSVDPSGGSISNWQKGWIFGFGVEQMLGGGWSTSLEYSQVKLDPLTHNPGYWYKPFRDTHEIELGEISIGLKYHF